MSGRARAATNIFFVHLRPQMATGGYVAPFFAHVVRADSDICKRGATESSVSSENETPRVSGASLRVWGSATTGESNHATTSDSLFQSHRTPNVIKGDLLSPRGRKAGERNGSRKPDSKRSLVCGTWAELGRTSKAEGPVTGEILWGGLANRGGELTGSPALQGL